MATWHMLIADIHGSVQPVPMSGPRVGQILQLSKDYEADTEDDALAQAWSDWDQAYAQRPVNPRIEVGLRYGSRSWRGP